MFEIIGENITFIKVWNHLWNSHIDNVWNHRWNYIILKLWYRFEISCENVTCIKVYNHSWKITSIKVWIKGGIISYAPRLEIIGENLTWIQFSNHWWNYVTCIKVWNNWWNVFSKCFVLNNIHSKKNTSVDISKWRNLVQIMHIIINKEIHFPEKNQFCHFSRCTRINC